MEIVDEKTSSRIFMCEVLPLTRSTQVKVGVSNLVTLIRFLQYLQPRQRSWVVIRSGTIGQQETIAF